MASVVIAAHNEAAVIGRCLESIASGGGPGELDVTVVANGCTDGTVAQAARYPWVRVVDLPAPGKAAALNAADRVAVGFPRVYLDADIVVSGTDLRRLCAELVAADPAPLVVAPRRELVLAGRPLPVRAYYAIQSRLPAFADGLFGRGMIVLSEAGRARFGEFPEVIADDLFLDSQYLPGERRQDDSVVSRVETPRRTRDLVNRLVRVRRGNAELRRLVAGDQVAGRVRDSDRYAWLREVVLPRPWLAPAAACYVALTLVAARAARRPVPDGQEWLRDESSRLRTGPEGAR